MKGGRTEGVLHGRLFPIKGAAVYMGFSPWTVREMIWKGEIPYVKVGAKYFLDVADIDKWIENNKTKFTF